MVKGQFWGKCGASHCNQWGLSRAEVREPIEFSLGVESGVGLGRVY